MTAPIDEVSTAILDRFERWVRVVLFPGARLTLWVLFYLSMLLGGWVLLGMSFGGWSPVVVTSASMEPAISVGDVLLVDTSPGDTISQRSIVVFERADGTVVAHRVFSVEGDELVTKGDANPNPDTERVATSEVDGAARVLVPLIGLPAVWQERGDIAPLLAWLTLTLAGAIHFVLTLVPALRHRMRKDHDEVDLGQVGIRRVRILVGVLIVAQFVLDPSRFEVLGSGGGELPLLLSLVAVLVATNAASVRLTSPQWRRRLPAIELAVDTLLVVFLSGLTGSSGLGWVLFALPIIEAAVRFGLVGALNHWMVLTTVTVGTRIWTYELSGSIDLLGELEQTLDQMSVLFLVVVPGAYLAEQLIGDVADQRRAISRAEARSELLERVAESSRYVSQLDGQHIDAVIDGTKRLGFGVVDLVATTDGVTWRKLGGDDGWDIPEPGLVGSGLTAEDLEHSALLIDGADAEEHMALAKLGLSTAVVAAVARNDQGRAVLRGGVAEGQDLTSGEIDAFRLLAGQAAVALQNHELLNEITSIHGELEHQAHHDSLTRLPNRVMMLEELDEALEQDKHPVLMFLDLDGFKPVNDRLGHEAGDELLRSVAERLLAASPRDSLTARVGGDEFTVLIRGNLSVGRAEAIAMDIISAIREPFEVNGEVVRIGTSVGIALGDRQMTGTELIRRADVAMYIAKQRQTDPAFEFFRLELDQAAVRRASLAEGIQNAIARRQIRVCYQPVFRLIDGREIAGVEALVRWDHPEFGSVPAPDTIAAAKSAKSGSALHRFISAEATEAVASWLRDEPSRPLFLTINASPEDLASNHLVPNLVKAVNGSGLDPRRVFVEISEQLVSPDAPGVMDNIHALNQAGIRMLLDDFGEGQTSLSYIHELPVAGIKLDRKLVVNALRSETDRIVIESIVDLCRRLGLVVIAEGIEDEEHLDVITSIGCSMAQGFHLGIPQNGDEIRDILRGTREATTVTAESRS